MPKAEYRSAVRSRTLIKQAFLAELAERDLEQISVSDVVRRAGVNRSTFYAHYSNIPGLLSDFEGEVLHRLHTVLQQVEFPAVFQDPEPLLAMVADYLSEDADVYRTLVQAHGAQQFLAELDEVFSTYMSAHAHVPPALRDSPMFQIRLAYFCGGITSLYTKWLLGTLPYDLSEVTREVARMIRTTSRGLVAGEFE